MFVCKSLWRFSIADFASVKPGFNRKLRGLNSPTVSRGLTLIAFLTRLEPCQRRAGHGPCVARRPEEEVLRLSAAHRRHHRRKDLPASGAQEGAQLMRRRPRGGCPGGKKIQRAKISFKPYLKASKSYRDSHMLKRSLVQLSLQQSDIINCLDWELRKILIEKVELKLPWTFSKNYCGPDFTALCQNVSSS